MEAFKVNEIRFHVNAQPIETSGYQYFDNSSVYYCNGNAKCNPPLSYHFFKRVLHAFTPKPEMSTPGTLVQREIALTP
jgi:hypothetical protein